MASRPIVTCSPLVATTSSSRGSGCVCSSFASAISRLVSPAIAEGTTTRSWPAAFHLATRCATFLIRSTEPTEVPPNFWTISAMKGAEFYRRRKIPRLLQDAVKPEERERGGKQDGCGRDRGEKRGDLGFFLLHHDLRAQRLVHLLEIERGAGVEVFGAREIGDRFQRLLVEAHAHRPALAGEDLAVVGAHAHREYAHAALRGEARDLDRIGPGRGLAVGEKDDRA